MSGLELAIVSLTNRFAHWPRERTDEADQWLCRALLGFNVLARCLLNSAVRALDLFPNL